MKNHLQLSLQTADLIAGFMVWVVLSSLLPYIKQDIFIPADQIALITAIPVVLGSVLRVPFGYCTNLFGARTMFLVSFIALIPPVWLLSEARTYGVLLIAGVFLGIAGAVFSIGVTSLPKYYSQNQHGLVNGVYGFGNMGTALTTWLAPVAAATVGWRATVRLYLVLLAASIILNFVLGDARESRAKIPIGNQLRAIGNDTRLWSLSLFYFVTFGSFVALTVYLPNFLTSHYAVGGVSAGIATSVFIVVAAVMRVLGGWLSDRFNCYRLLIAVFAGLAAGSAVLTAALSLPAYLVGVYVVSVACGIGNGVVFKLVPAYFSQHAGLANGLVSMAGGLGGFFPPLALSSSMLLFGTDAVGLMAFGGFSLMCLAIAVLAARHQQALS